MAYKGIELQTVLDSHALIAHFRGELAGVPVKELLEKTGKVAFRGDRPRSEDLRLPRPPVGLPSGPVGGMITFMRGHCLPERYDAAGAVGTARSALRSRGRLVLLLTAVFAAGLPTFEARAAKRSEKQLEMDRQREEMRRLTEERKLNPNKPLAPPMSPTGRSLIIPPPSTGRAAEPASPDTAPATSPAPAPAAPEPPAAVPPPAAPPPVSPPEPRVAVPVVPAAMTPKPAAPAAPAVPSAPAARPETPEEMVARVIGTPPPAASAPGAIPLASASSGPAGDALLAHASFQRGAKLFNAALDIYRRFQTDRNPARLREVPILSEQAARAFQECRAAFPDDARIPKYVEQCYGLTRYARQSELMSSGAAPR